LARLKRDLEINNAVFVANKSRHNVNAVVQAYSAFDHPPDAYLRGPFAEAIRWAHGFDFLRFYEEEVLHHLSRDVLLLSDRWSACWITYAEAGLQLGRELEQLLACVQPPDITIYLDVSPEEAVRRIVGRGGPKGGEHVEILRACANAYERWLPQLSAQVVRIRNDDFETTYRHVVSLVEQIWRKGS
jgi:thymidylate kinase